MIALYGVTSNDDDLRTVNELAEFLGVSQATLNQWRWRGKGPRWIRVGRHIRYPRFDTEAWLAAGADSPEQARTDSAGGSTDPPATKPTNRTTAKKTARAK